MCRLIKWLPTMMVVLLLSCNRDLFDEAEYKEIIEKAQPVEKIDANHTWGLVSTYYMTAPIPSSATDAQKLLVMSGNPYAGETTTILGSYLVVPGETLYFSFVAPVIDNQFYAALVDAAGTYTITGFKAGQHTISFSQPIASKTMIEDNMGKQSFTYCFEDEMPEPGDYDYNDLVLRMSMERTATNQITLDVTLAAVGSVIQMAAAIHILGYQFDEIESVTTVDNESFNEGYKFSAFPYIESKDLLIEGTKGEAVINLFEDAHWATGVIDYVSEGYLPRYKYNVAKTTSSEHDMMSPRTLSYIITFKNPIQLNYFSLDNLDPFAIVEYMGTLMEIHSVYQYRSSSVLHEYVQPENASILPWALIVPSAGFRYPLDGVNIGFFRNDALFGAYMTTNHGFGEWAADHNRSVDWYEYPTSNKVY